MTTTELAQSIGKPVLHVSGNLKFMCVVADARISFGKPQFLIRPIAGYGERWVEFSSIEPYQDMAHLKRAASSVNQLVLRMGP
jgi:hypothetical protein